MLAGVTPGLLALPSLSSILRPQDVFATSLSTSNGGSNTIVNGIDLLGKGGLVIFKNRSMTEIWKWTDTKRGALKYLSNDSISVEATGSGVVQFNNDGYVHAGYATTGYSLLGYSIACAPKFFDIVLYTGDGTSGRQIAHTLGVAPGMVVVFRRDTSGQDRLVYHRSLTLPSGLLLNTTDAAGSQGTQSFQAVDTSSITVGGNARINASGGTYVAYLFAHDPSASGIIQCGSATSASDGSYTVTGLPGAPQFVLLKLASAGSDWLLLDTTRGWGAGVDKVLTPNTSSQEATTERGAPTAGGFNIAGDTVSGVAGETLIYLAIRAPT